MIGLIEGIAGGLVGRWAARILRADTGDQPPFAQLLAARMSDPDAQAAESLAARLTDLPITSGEARRIAARLVELVKGLKATGGRDAQQRIAQFISDVSRKYSLSGNDAARLNGIAQDYAEKELLTGLPV